MKKINAHGHLLPYPNEIPRFMQDKKLFWVDKFTTAALTKFLNV